MGNCAGVDWASEKHDVVVQDEAGGELLAATFARRLLITRPVQRGRPRVC
jgi:hypothetical protein